MKMCPCCSLNWWAFCYPKYPARAEMVTWLDVLGGKLEQKRLKPLLAVYTLIPWRKTVTLENVPKSLARFVRQMGFFRTSILKFLARLFCFWWWECPLKSEVRFLVFASFYAFLMSNGMRIGIFSLCSLLWHIILYTDTCVWTWKQR